MHTLAQYRQCVSTPTAECLQAIETEIVETEIDEERVQAIRRQIQEEMMAKLRENHSSEAMAKAKAEAEENARYAAHLSILTPTGVRPRRASLGRAAQHAFAKASVDAGNV